ncbi:MAG: hypothetical protein M4579_003192 [Chaenotheca gracillima]|nr:MAG: hypothetical protein M4579_003192 [Chaenotheca gracillima]
MDSVSADIGNGADSWSSPAFFKSSSRNGYQEVYSAPRKRKEIGSWVQKLDNFLPAELRVRPGEIPEQLDQFEPIDPDPSGIAGYLRKARNDLGQDLLTYIGVKEGRWYAVAYLTEKLLRGYRSGKSGSESQAAHALASVAPGLSLDDLSAASIHVDRQRMVPGEDDSAHNHMSDLEATANGFGDMDRQQPLAEVLQSLGYTILAAADRGKDNAFPIIFHVRQVIAHLHHVDAVPSTVYDSTPANKAGAMRRPPTLHLLSSRILTSASDAVWRSHEIAVAAHADSLGIDHYWMGYEVPGARWKLRVRELGLEVWMELILWICVEHHLFFEGSWVLREMKKRSQDHNSWSVLNWNAVQDPSLRTDPRSARVDWDKVRSRHGGAVGNREGYSSDAPFVELGDRTVSSEVVSAFVDGLANDLWSGDTRPGHSPRNTLDLIRDLKDLLLRDEQGLGVNSWNQVIQRLIDSGAKEQDEDPRFIESVLDLAPTYREEEGARNAPVSDGPQQQEEAPVSYESAAPIGLLHHHLEERSRSGSVRGALRIFERLQLLTDKNKNNVIHFFLSDLDQQAHVGVEGTNPQAAGLDVPGLFPQIPPRVLASFLDLLVEAEVFEFAKWLIYADDIDGPSIPESLYSNPLMIPSLLHFAYATSDSALMSKVIAPLSQPLPTEVARALLHCQVSLKRWDSVREMLNGAKHSSDTLWNAETVAALARAALQLEMQIESSKTADPQRAEIQQHLETSFNILEGVLSGSYGTPELGTSGAQGFLTTLRQVIGSASPPTSRLSNFYDKSFGASVGYLPAQAFNVLLRAVSETQGCNRTRELWKLWCRDPLKQPSKVGLSSVKTEENLDLEDEHDDSDLVRETNNANIRRIIDPNVSTVRIIVQTAVREWRIILQEAQRSDDGTSLQSRLDRIRVPVNGTRPVDERQKFFRISDDSSHARSIKATDWYNSLFNWGAEMLRRFNLNDEEIQEEMSECVIRRHSRSQGRWKLRF